MSQVKFVFGDKQIIMQCSPKTLLKDLCLNFGKKINKDINNLYFLYEGKLLDLNLNFYELGKDTIDILVVEKNSIIEEKFTKDIHMIIEVKSKDVNKDINIININKNKDLNEKDIALIIEGKKHNFSEAIKFQKSSKYSIKLEFNKEFNDCSYLFKNCYNIINISFNDFSLKNIDNMEGIFYNCNNLSKLDLSKLDTSKVTNMKKMFYGCSLLSNLNLSNFNTSNVKDMSEMFSLCENLKDLNLPNFNTQNVTNLSKIFKRCISLSNLNLSNFNTLFVQDMSEMFSMCYSLKDLNLSNFNTQNVINTSGMFYGCTSLIKLNLSNFNTSNVKDMSEMFSLCENLKDLNLSNFNTQNVTNLSKIFKRCIFLSNLNLSNFNTSNVQDISELFSECYNLKKIDLSSFDFRNIKNINRMFYNCEKLKSIILPKSTFNNLENLSGLFYGCSSLITLPDEISEFNTRNVTDMSNIFYGCYSLNSLPDINKWDISNVINLNGCFSGCSSLKVIPDISKWNTKNIINLSSLFYDCSSLKEIPDISKWNTSSVKDMSFIFSKCSSLISLNDISKLNTSNVTDMSYMFYKCSSLKEMPDLSKWNTSKVENMSYMFYGCSSIKYIDIEKIDTRNLKDISHMFSGCTNLINFGDIANWNTKKLIKMNKFISDCPSLKHIPDISKWEINLKNKKKYISSKIDKISIKKGGEEDKTKSWIIEDDNMKFFPQIELNFDKVNQIKKDIISNLRNEIEKLINKKEFSIIKIRKGSIHAILTLQYIIKDNSTSIGKLSNEFSEAVNKEIQRIISLLKNYQFISLGSTRPDFIDNNIIDITNKENRNQLKATILNLPDYDDINFFEAAKNINMEDIYKFFRGLSLNAEELENNQQNILAKLEKYDNIFEMEMEKALKNSIFEYKIINIIIIDKNDDEYQRAKNNCRNIETKILFHGTKIDAITGILSAQFYDAGIAIFGPGVYFTDMLDYAWYYAGEEYRGNFEIIPRIGNSFSFVASEIFYDRNKRVTVYNNNLRYIPVEQNGIRCAFVHPDSSVISENELNNYTKFKGTEFLITCKNQIIPLYSVTVQRIENLIIWRDYNFSENNPNNYDSNTFSRMQNFHKRIKYIIQYELNSKVYFINTTEEAIELLNKKKYNKVIIITNGSNNGKDFIIEARKIIGANTIAAVTAYDIARHISWVKDMKNVLILNGIDFHKKFLRAVINQNFESLQNLRNEIIECYSNINGFELRELTRDLFNFPKFKSEGRFEELDFGQRNEESSCYIY